MGRTIGWLRLHKWTYYLLLFSVGGGIGLWWQANYYDSWRHSAIVGIPMVVIYCCCYSFYHWSKGRTVTIAPWMTIVACIVAYMVMLTILFGVAVWVLGMVEIGW